MKKNLIFVIFCFTLIIDAQASSSNFDTKKIACDVYKVMPRSKEVTLLRWESIHKFREKLMEPIPWFQFYDKLVYSRSRASTVAMIDFDRFWDGKSPDIAGKYQNLIRQKKITPRDKENIVSLIDKYPASPMYWEHLSKDHQFHLLQNYLIAGLRVSEPLLMWLLNQPDHSINFLQLVKNAIHIYQGDHFTALGVIGLMFFTEVYDLYYRESNSLLSSKMNDALGSNYHFWIYLNLSVLGDRWKPQMLSIMYEGVFKWDMTDLLVDHKAIMIGKHLSNNIEAGNCNLD